MLARGSQLPHIALTTVSGGRIDYRDLWQHHNVAIVCVAGDNAAQPFVDAAAEFARRHAVCIATRESLDLLPCPGIAIADRWGEIVHVDDNVPPVEDVLVWLDHLEQRCPECEGEAR